MANTESTPVNYSIVTMIKERISYGILSCLVVTVSIFALIYVYLNLGTIIVGLLGGIGGIIHFLGSILYYYTVYPVRYLAMFTSGLSLDVLDFYCTIPYEWKSIHDQYIYKNNLLTNQSYYHTQQYYDYCIYDNKNVYYGFVYGHIIILFGLISIAAFGNDLKTYYRDYLQNVQQINSTPINPLSNHQTNGYEMIHNEYIQLIPFSTMEFHTLSYDYAILTLFLLSTINNFLRLLNVVHLFLYLDILFFGSLVSRLFFVPYLLKITPTVSHTIENV